MSERIYPVKRNGEYEVDIERLAFGGSGVARVDNYVIFVRDAIPGDRVLIRIRKRKKTHAEASLIKVLKNSPKRRTAPCPYFNWCGGCTWQNMEYEDQLHFKWQIVKDSLERIGGLKGQRIHPVLPSEKIFGYRNKMEFSFSEVRWLLPEQLGDERFSKYFALGLHVPGTFDKILHIENCLLQTDKANAILRYVSDYAQKHHMEPYNIRTHQGFLRFLVLRSSRYSGRIMVNIVTGFEHPETLRSLAQSLMEQFPEIQSVVNNINERPAQIAFGEKEIVLRGTNTIEEKIGPFIFQISANSFFQTNTAQAERLYEIVIKMAGMDGTNTVWDLYSGTGTIAMFLAREAGQVIGFELVESAVKNARDNIRQNGLRNISFVQGDILAKLRHEPSHPDIIVTDPPRAGMHEKITRQILQKKPHRIIYVSCNPTTLARDLEILLPDYRVSEVQPVDMFPHTYHIETVVKLDRK